MLFNKDIMAEETTIGRETLKRLKIFKDTKVQQEYEKALDRIKSETKDSPDVITIEQKTKLMRARQLAAEYFKRGAVVDVDTGADTIKTN
jgi:lipase chaperone LimK